VGKQRTRRRAARALLALALAAAPAGLAACGGSDASSGGSAGAASDAPGVAAAQKVYDQYTQRPTKIPITQPVGKPIPAGKKIVYIACAVPACQVLAKQFTEGAKVLGWSVKTVNAGGSPTDIQSAWAQAVREKPDAVVSSGTSRAVFEKQLQQLKALDIPVVQCCVTDPAEDGLNLVLDNNAFSSAIPKMEAAWATTQSGGNANTLYVNFPAFPIIAANKKYFIKYYGEWCKGCGLDQLDLPLEALGKDAAQRVVSYLRSHPKINMVVMSTDSATLGVPAALKSAGLADKVKIIGNTSTVQNLQYIATGQEHATIPYHTFEAMWTEVDALARIFTGQSVEPDNVPLPYMLVTKDNLPSSNADFPLVVDYQEQFKKLWGK
jgi:ribose transport system substrate-binding protein